MMREEKFTGDPYFYVREDLEHRITITRELYDKWSDTVKRGSAGYTSQFRLDTRRLLQNLEEMEELLAELQKCVTKIEENKTSEDVKSLIDKDELLRRKKYLSDVKELVASIRDNMDTTKTALKESQRTAQKDLKRKMKEAKIANEEETQGLIRGVRSQQEFLVKEQDKVLIEMGDQLTKLNNMASTINDEVREQTHLVHSMNEDIDQGQDRLKTVRTKVQALLQTNNCFEIKVILVMIVITIILLFLVFS